MQTVIKLKIIYEFFVYSGGHLDTAVSHLGHSLIQHGAVTKVSSYLVHAISEKGTLLECQ